MRGRSNQTRWVVHNPEHRNELPTAKGEKFDGTFHGLEEANGPPTLTSIPIFAVEWSPNEEEPFSVIDLLRSSKPLAKCQTLTEAEQKARRAV